MQPVFWDLGHAHNFLSYAGWTQTLRVWGKSILIGGLIHVTKTVVLSVGTGNCCVLN